MISAILGFTPKLITNKQTNNQKINNFKYSNFYSKYNLEKDTVSFSGKHSKPEPSQFSPRVESALGIKSKLNKLYRSNSLSLESIQELLSSKSPVPVTVKSMSEVPDLMNAKNCKAYMQPIYEKDMKLSGAIIYLNPDFSNKREATSLIADCVHEYTHILQRHEDGDYIGIAKYTSNLEEARFLGFIAGHTMKDFEKSLLKPISTKDEFIDIFEKKMKTQTPITKEDIIPFLPDKEQLKDDLDFLLNANFRNTMDIFKVPKQYMGEYLYFFHRAKPILEQSVIKQFEMESEAKQADIEARKTGLLPSAQSAFFHSLNKGFYDAVVEVLKN